MTTTIHDGELIFVERAAGEGDAVWALGTLYQIKLRAAESAGRLTVMETTAPPGSASPLHVHRRESEAFYMLEGEMTCRVGEEIHHLRPGGFIHLPQDVPHAFRVTGDVPARCLDLAFGGGIEGLFERVGRPAQALCLPPPATEEGIGRWLKEAPGFGIEILGPPLSGEPAATSVPDRGRGH